MKFRDTLLATAATAALAVYALPASAEPALADGVCPAVSLSTGCNLLITFNANGSVTTTAGSSPGQYDGSEDTLVGVVNNTSSVINGFNLTSTQNIFGFEADGIDAYATAGISPTGTNPDTTGYGGPDGYFTNIGTTGSGANTGMVNFANGGIAAGGGHDYFALEESVSLTAPPVITPAPEPASMAILGVGMLGAGVARRFRRKA